MAYGIKAAADPTDLANACGLDNSEQQDGQEFMKLLLEKLDQLFRGSGNPQVCSSLGVCFGVGVCVLCIYSLSLTHTHMFVCM